MLTNRPWEVAAATPLPAVVIPRDGPDATAEVARRYGADWMLVTQRFYDPELEVGLVYRESPTERTFSGLPRSRAELSGLDLSLARVTPLGRLYRIDAPVSELGSE